MEAAHARISRTRCIPAATAAAIALGGFGAAPAVAAPYVQSAKFTRTTGAFYSQFGDLISIVVAGSPKATAVCVNGKCKRYDGGRVATSGLSFGRQRFLHGRVYKVIVFACSATCMTNVWTRNMTAP